MAEKTAERAHQAARETTAAAHEAADRGAGTARRAGEAAVAGPEVPFPFARDDVESLARAGQVLLDGTAELGTVWLSFWQEQLAEGAEALRALVECRTWDEALERQNAFTRASVERACARAARSAELTAGMIGEGLKPLRESAQRTAERALRPGA